MGLEAVRRAQLAQGVDGAGRAVAEPEVRADVDLCGVQRLDEHLLDELVRSQLGELVGERQHQRRVDAALGDQLQPVVERSEGERRSAGMDDRHRVRVERHHDRGGTGLTGPGDDEVDDELVAAVDAVEVADGRDRRSTPSTASTDATPARCRTPPWSSEPATAGTRRSLRGRDPQAGANPGTTRRRSVGAPGQVTVVCTPKRSSRCSPASTDRDGLLDRGDDVDEAHIERSEAEPDEIGLAEVADDPTRDERLHDAVRLVVAQRHLAAACVLRPRCDDREAELAPDACRRAR